MTPGWFPGGGRNRVPPDRDDGEKGQGAANRSSGLAHEVSPPSPQAVQSTQPPRRQAGRAPLTQERLGELLTVLLHDINAWSAKYGYENVPPIEILRQTTNLGEAIGYAQRRDGVDL